MSKSFINITVDSGPKKGETLDRKPGSIIRIGRVVKGNTLAIKDALISQKHLAIEFDPVVSGWVIRDLATSNGTFVNGGLLSSTDSPFPLSDGDVIKIGDSSISVRVFPIEMGNGGRRMRNRTTVGKKEGILEPELDERVDRPEPLGRNSSVVKENKDEVVEDGRMKVSENLGRRRGRKSAAVSKKEEILEPGLDEKFELPENVGRNCADAKDNRDETMVDKRLKVSENLGRGRTMRTRVSKKGEILDSGLEEERIELPENLGRNSLDVKETRDGALEDDLKVPENLGRGRRGKSVTVSKKNGATQDDIINATKHLRGGRTVSIRISENDPSMDLVVEDRGGNSSSVYVENKNLELQVECCIEVPKNSRRGRNNSKSDVVLEDKNEVAKAMERGRRTMSADVSEEDGILNLVVADKNSVPKTENLAPFVEVSKNLGRGRRNSKKDAGLKDKNEVLKTTGRGRGRGRTRSAKVLEEDDILNSVAKDKISVPKNAGKRRRTRVSKLDETLGSIEDEGRTEAKKKLGRGKQRADCSKVSKKDETFDDVAEDAGVKEKPGWAASSSKVSKTDDVFIVVTEDAVIKEKPRRTYSSKVSKIDEKFDVVVEDAVVKQKPRRLDSSKAAKTDKIFDVAAEDAVVKENPRRGQACRTRASSKVSKDLQLLESPLDRKNPDLNPVGNSYQLKELSDDFHRLSKQDKIQGISLISSSAADSKDKRSENLEGKENCVSTKCQKAEDETVGRQTHKPFRVVPTVWNGNGIPNTTTKYKEDQKISWHGTPFEERVERALSDDKLFPQRNPTN